ncbi:50S ribosomal protein L6 [Plasticicumulans sp.]|uniref:50S ribosomal protein L6 n=1 Tax=Plasticicumulans sp. TaxID=2307179 RepID=UPI000FAEEF38|nr:50S ribosomal protein L6 [Plasticicumulans sp.]MBS0601808.1 50S ribosomal protein L6 [Pseudomonadota bacterium]RTK96370.1 MAG: 50S ribosomal protein L6 [Xanthomonadales bacterium]HMV37597.1 50S ribosomal protein L6 [Plasticicumulans sp.]HMW28162.1 50S ribosomal protein L6 [Plasticicumulans sp.]HMW40798.1 50S ribosomal protein L6 [Plasticicumulans sp.]
MSRVAKKPVALPAGVSVAVDGRKVSVKGAKGALDFELHPTVAIVHENNELKLVPQSEAAEHRAMAGTMRALVANMVTGVSKGFERKLQLVGVGYRAQAQGAALNLTLGFSHPVVFDVPQGITVETPTQTEILVKGVDKQKVGQVAAKIRAFRPPEPYKGKGVRYADETIVLKEAKKK